MLVHRASHRDIGGMSALCFFFLRWRNSGLGSVLSCSVHVGSFLVSCFSSAAGENFVGYGCVGGASVRVLGVDLAVRDGLEPCGHFSDSSSGASFMNAQFIRQTRISLAYSLLVLTAAFVRHIALKRASLSLFQNLC